MKNLISDIAVKIKSSKIRNMFKLASTLDDVVNLGIGEPDFDTPPNIIKAAEKAMAAGLTHYTSNVGNLDLRQAVAARLERQNEIVADPEKNIIITTGAMGGLYLSMRVLLNPGDEVILPMPSWTNYSSHIELAGGVPVPLVTTPHTGFAPTSEQLRQLITSQTKALLINTPTNPTGTVYSQERLEELAHIALDRDLIVISDEVYEKFIWDDARHFSIASLPGMADRTVTINSLSKTYAMTGWRVGYTCGPAKVVAAMTKLQEDVYACVGSISQAAALEAIRGPNDYLDKMVAEYAARREFILRSLTEIPCMKVFRPAGTFYVFIDISSTGLFADDYALRLLEEEKVCLVPGTAFGSGGESFIRVAYTNSIERLEEAVRRMRDFASRL